MSKPTLSKHIRNGRLSAKQGEDGVYQIEEAELGRFMSSYRRAEPVEAPTGLPAGQGAAKASSAVEVELAVMQERARQLEERLAETREALARAERRADEAQARADKAQERVALIEGPGVAERRGLWARLVGR